KSMFCNVVYLTEHFAAQVPDIEREDKLTEMAENAAFLGRQLFLFFNESLEERYNYRAMPINKLEEMMTLGLQGYPYTYRLDMPAPLFKDSAVGPTGAERYLYEFSSDVAYPFSRDTR